MPHCGPLILDLAYNVCCIIGRTIIYNDKFNNAGFADYFIDQTTNSRRGVISRDNDAYIDFILHIELRLLFVVIFKASELDNLSFSEFLVDIK